MQNKTFLLSDGSQIVRILEESEQYMVIDCIRQTMPHRADREQFKNWKPYPEEMLCRSDMRADREEKDIPPEDAAVMHRRFTLIAPLIPMVGQEQMRSAMIELIAEKNKITKQTVRKYFCLYLTYQKKCVLAPLHCRQKKELTEDEKNFRWALNKFYFTQRMYSLNTAYTMMLNEKYTDSTGKGIYSVGRVQTPTLAIVVEREMAIRNFKSTPYFALSAVFTAPSGKDYTAKYKKERIEKKEDADSIFRKIDGKDGVVTDIQKKVVTKEAPLLYSLSALQMDANAKFGLTLKRTLEVVQKLYDSGYTTYPRTNSRYLTEDMEPVINDVLNKLSTVSEYKKLISGRTRKFDFPHYFNDKKVESHFAIIPTGVIPTSLTGVDAKVYDLICRTSR